MKLTQLAKQYTYENILAESTIQSYLRRAALFDRSCAYKSIEKLTNKDALQWRDSLIARNVRNTTINNYIRHCKALWKFAYQNGFVSDENVFSIGKLPEIKLNRVISNEAIDTALAIIPSFEHSWFWSTVVLLQARLGIRNRQLVNIRCEDIDLINATLYCRPEGNKTRQSNELPLPKEVAKSIELFNSRSRATLDRGLFQREYLFEIARYDHRYKKHADGMSDDQLQGMYKKLSEALEKTCGERITGHRLRHSLATEIGSRANVNIRVVQAFFGWSAIQTAQNYVKVGLSPKRALLGE